jgi:Ser/Thr protein kinase RdoA (MazF antagonist)
MSVAAMKLAGAPFVHELEQYLCERFGKPVRIEDVRPLGDDGGDKAWGYGVPLRLTLKGAPVREVVVHTVSPGRGGHDTLADRASEALLAFETFNALPRHVRALDVGAILDDGSRVSLARAREVFFVTAYGEGTPYFHDLDRIARDGAVDERDGRRVDALAETLARIHGEKRDAPETYRRKLRQLVGHDECIAGLVDTYDRGEVDAFASRAQLVSIEQRCVAWRHRLKAFAHRLARVHGDFHPWNLLFADDERLPTLLDRSRGAYGEPADDVAALAVNYLVRALYRDGGLRGPFGDLWTRFFRTYLDRTRDEEMGQVIPPFLVWRLLVLASPLWYPSFEPAFRRRLFGVMDALLSVERLDPFDPRAWIPDDASARIPETP